MPLLLNFRSNVEWYCKRGFVFLLNGILMRPGNEHRIQNTASNHNPGKY